MTKTTDYEIIATRSDGSSFIVPTPPLDAVYGTPATVGEIIAMLQQFPADLPCYFRPKYHGDVTAFDDDVPVWIGGISYMEDQEGENVTFLC